MFPVSVIDKPLCPVCVQLNLHVLLGSIMNSIARKPVVVKFELCVSQPLPHVSRLSRHAQFVSFYVNYPCLVNISVKLHIGVG